MAAEKIRQARTEGTDSGPLGCQLSESGKLSAG